MFAIESCWGRQPYPSASSLIVLNQSFSHRHGLVFLKSHRAIIRLQPRLTAAHHQHDLRTPALDQKPLCLLDQSTPMAASLPVGIGRQIMSVVTFHASRR